MPDSLKSSQLCILVNSLSGGGGETVALMLCHAFKSRGLDVMLLCIERNDMLDAAGVDVRYLSSKTGSENGLLKILSLPFLALKLKRFLRDNDCYWVQSHMYRANYVNVLARLFSSSHKVQIVNHGIAGRYRKMGLLGRVNLALIRFLYPRADQLLCPSTGMMKDLEGCAVPGEKMHLVPNPFKLDAIVASGRETLPEVYLAKVSGRKVIVSVGRFEGVKHTQDIIEAFALMYADNKNTCLVLVGEGSERSLLEQAIANHGLQDSVILTGYASNPFKYIANATMLITASEYEGFSNVIVEALALRVPVVSTDCPGGPREILSADYDGELRLEAGEVDIKDYGMLVPVADIKALHIAMSRLMNDDELREELKKKGHERAAVYSVDRIVDQHLELMSELRTKDTG